MTTNNNKTQSTIVSERITRLETIVAALGESVHELARHLTKHEELIEKISEGLDNKLNALGEKFSTATKTDWRLIFSALAVFATISGIVISAIIMPLQVSIAHNKENIIQIENYISEHTKNGHLRYEVGLTAIEKHIAHIEKEDETLKQDLKEYIDLKLKSLCLTKENSNEVY